MLTDKALDFHHTVSALTEAMTATTIETETPRNDAIELATALGRAGYVLVQTNEDNPVKAQAATFLSRFEDTE